MFEIKNPKNGKITHGGVLELISEEGCCNIPYWASHVRCSVLNDLKAVENIALYSCLMRYMRFYTENSSWSI
ncbi:hypothetical protein BEWA_032600 [Theileria equi strain WA]|uniref:Ubiquitin fusion degradation protein UFD1 N-terminal subdomain 1 domain-containing protein n=1 Tax=Theileria equi strain WA TaxID=1537102 RepID=L0AXW7_THEEQ|nr:hypothetical protein BEWA_032600 [Theileria equi strain WA]AFZ80407.1 hypothetical protein BEWA_032600 [Theileria equi strain WA]|eukprot:XP_004830073.1 hypothetical protein BEWA_032600 [Theileria equi strain WA]